MLSTVYGHAPVTIDPTQAPWSIIPPVFHAFRDRGVDDGLHTSYAMMTDSGALEGSRCTPSHPSGTPRTLFDDNLI